MTTPPPPPGEPSADAMEAARALVCARRNFPSWDVMVCGRDGQFLRNITKEASLNAAALDAFAAAARMRAVEECARICVRRSCTWDAGDDARSEDFREGIELAASQLAAAIRALAPAGHAEGGG